MELKKLSEILKENPDFEIEGFDVLAFDCRDIFQLTISELADLDRHLADNDYQEFCDIFVIGNPDSRYLYKIIEEFGRQKETLKETYRFVFNPPTYGDPKPDSPGDELRKDFVEEFGSYVILMDLVMGWANTSYKEVEQWTVEQFFFWANYLSGQKILENVK